MVDVLRAAAVVLVLYLEAVRIEVAEGPSLPVAGVAVLVLVGGLLRLAFLVGVDERLVGVHWLPRGNREAELAGVLAGLVAACVVWCRHWGLNPVIWVAAAAAGLRLLCLRLLCVRPSDAPSVRRPLWSKHPSEANKTEAR